MLLSQRGADAALPIYRGTTTGERRRRLYGFSWTTSVDIARLFAEGNRNSGLDGIVLHAVAEPDAILHVREVDGFYSEGEVIVDPFRLGRIRVAERLPAAPRK